MYHGFGICGYRYVGTLQDVDMTTFSAYIIAYKEIRKIQAAVQSVLLADEIVVVRRRAGVSELIESGRNGYVFEEPAELGLLLVRLTDPDLRRRLGETARRTALSHGWKWPARPSKGSATGLQAAAAHDMFLCRRVVRQADRHKCLRWPDGR